MVRTTNTLKLNPLNLSSHDKHRIALSGKPVLLETNILQLLVHPPSVGFTAGCHGPAAGLGPASQTKKDELEDWAMICRTVGRSTVISQSFLSIWFIHRRVATYIPGLQRLKWEVT